MVGKKIIAVDIDDVLASQAKSFVDFTNRRWGTRLTIEGYDEHWAKVWKIDNEKELYAIADEYFEQFRYFDNMLDAQKTLGELKKRYRLVVVTSRRRKVDDITREWLDKNYPGVFSEVHYSGAWDDEEKHSDHKNKATKAQLLQEIGADYLIDDQPKHCVAAAEAGITSILFGDYKWNRSIKLLPNMTRARDWREVLEYFDGR